MNLRTFARIAMAAVALAFLSLAAPRPAAAAPLGAASAQVIGSATAPAAETVQWRHRRYYRRHWGYRPVYRPIYRPYRRCWTRPQMVRTPWGWRRRLVRVCR